MPHLWSGLSWISSLRIWGKSNGSFQTNRPIRPDSDSELTGAGSSQRTAGRILSPLGEHIRYSVRSL